MQCFTARHTQYACGWSPVSDPELSTNCSPGLSLLPPSASSDPPILLCSFSLWPTHVFNGSVLFPEGFCSFPRRVVSSRPQQLTVGSFLLGAGATSLQPASGVVTWVVRWHPPFLVIASIGLSRLRHRAARAGSFSFFCALRSGKFNSDFQQ